MELLRNKPAFDNKAWISIEKDLHIWISRNEKHMIERKNEELLNALLKSVDKEVIEKELEEIRQKEQECIQNMLRNAKEKHKKELQSKIDAAK